MRDLTVGAQCIAHSSQAASRGLGRNALRPYSPPPRATQASPPHTPLPPPLRVRRRFSRLSVHFGMTYVYILKASRSHLSLAPPAPSPLLFLHSLLVPLAPWARPSERRRPEWRPHRK